jgi:hypothetical protein
MRANWPVNGLDVASGGHGQTLPAARRHVAANALGVQREPSVADTLLLRRSALALQIGDVRMFGKTTRRLALAVGLATVAFTATQPAFAQDETFFPVGVACPDFILGLKATGGNLVTREFKDADGNLVRTITAGKGADLTWTNYGTVSDPLVAVKSVTVKTAGSVTKLANNPDGTQTLTQTGHNGLILFPTDIPEGPTTTQYVGRVVTNIDPETGVFTLLSTSGPERDICAELA